MASNGGFCSSAAGEEMYPVLHHAKANRARHPTLAHHALDDSAVFAFEVRVLLDVDVVRWRRLVLDELMELRNDLANEKNQ